MDVFESLRDNTLENFVGFLSSIYWSRILWKHTLYFSLNTNYYWHAYSNKILWNELVTTVSTKSKVPASQLVNAEVSSGNRKAVLSSNYTTRIHGRHAALWEWSVTWNLFLVLRETRTLTFWCQRHAPHHCATCPQLPSYRVFFVHKHYLQCLTI